MRSDDNYKTTMAVCPFCKKITTVTGRILKDIAVIDGDEMLAELLTNTNRVECSRCGSEFFYEYSCAVISTGKCYAVAELPVVSSFPDGKASLFKILGTGCRLRYVQEFIYLCEKARIFEFDLDDRVMEVIKYKYLAKPMGLGTDAKIILTGADSNALIFTVYDDNDRQLAVHRVSAAAYGRTCAELGDKLTGAHSAEWLKIDLKWAEKFTKEIEK